MNPNRALTFENLDRTDLTNIYWFIDESLKYDTPTNRDILYEWKNDIGDRYSEMYGTKRTVTIVFKGVDYDVLMGAVDLNLRYVNSPRTKLAHKIKRLMV